MIRSLVFLLAVLLLPACTAEDAIRSATSAAPASISADATVMDWSFDVLREGNNDWTCLPNRPETTRGASPTRG